MNMKSFVLAMVILQAINFLSAFFRIEAQLTNRVIPHTSCTLCSLVQLLAAMGYGVWGGVLLYLS